MSKVSVEGTNAIGSLVQRGLIKQNQIDQSITARPIPPTQFSGDLFLNQSLEQSASPLKIDEYTSRKLELLNTDFITNQMPKGMAFARSSMISNIFFMIEENYYEQLKNIIGKILPTEVQLPFDVCTFRLAYLDKPELVTVKQDKETNELYQVDVFSGTRLPETELLQHVMACLVLIESGVGKITNKEGKTLDLKKASAPTNTPESFIVKTLNLVVDKKLFKNITSGQTNTGRKSPKFHVRRGHFFKRNGVYYKRRWAFVGSKLSGTIIKAYRVTSPEANS